MYYLDMPNVEQGVIPSRLQAAMDLRSMSAAELSKASGVHKATISLILSGDRPNTPAAIAAKLARGLFVSVDYLVGIADKPEPKALVVGDLLIELTRAAQRLPNRRQRDLLMMARAYLESSEEMRSNPDLLMDDLLDLIEEAGGTISRDKLIDFMEANDEDDSLGGGGPILPDDTQEPPQGDS